FKSPQNRRPGGIRAANLAERNGGRGNLRGLIVDAAAGGTRDLGRKAGSGERRAEDRLLPAFRSPLSAFDLRPPNPIMSPCPSLNLSPPPTRRRSCVGRADGCFPWQFTSSAAFWAYCSSPE